MWGASSVLLPSMPPSWPLLALTSSKNPTLPVDQELHSMRLALLGKLLGTCICFGHGVKQANRCAIEQPTIRQPLP